MLMCASTPPVLFILSKSLAVSPEPDRELGWGTDQDEEQRMRKEKGGEDRRIRRKEEGKGI